MSCSSLSDIYTGGPIMEKQPALIIYTDGTYERKIPLSAGQQMQIGQALIDDVRNAVLPPTPNGMPQEEAIKEAV